MKQLSFWLSFATCVAACGGTPTADDAGTDAPNDAAPRCGANADCDDGLVCNGSETCRAGACVAGTAMHCDDMIACTIDSCSEQQARCVFRVPDADGDGDGAASCVDGTGTPLGTDCDDHDAQRHHGATELCDTAHVDEDCDPTTLGGRDDDADGFVSALCCDDTTCGNDCDDTRPAVHVGATEVCNHIDDDCDGTTDEGVAVTGFVDQDRDGYGDPSMPTTACGTSVGFAADGTDCDDTRASVHPGQPELCDGIDNDCDATTGIDQNAQSVPWYRDADGDGFGNPAMTMMACMPPAGYSLLGTDCDDTNTARSPATAELCNGIDDDCNGVADFVIAAGDSEDDDRDGVPDANCHDPRAADCDDHDPTAAPGAVELCDGRDNDCDTRVDEGATQAAFYRDADGDGFGSSVSVSVGCTPPSGFARRGGDCDDVDPTRYPGALEPCDDLDNDCDGATDEGAYASASCAEPNALDACVHGACQRVACASGFADCTSGGGCESDVRSDAAHCGGCSPCAAGTCVGGRCQVECTLATACSATNVCGWRTCGTDSRCGTPTTTDCTPFRIDVTNTVTTAVAGAAASDFEETCAPGEMAIGMVASHSAAPGTFALSMLCSPAIPGAMVTFPSSDSTPEGGVGTGVPTGGPSAASCAAGQALSGLDVTVGTGHIASFRAHCVPMAVGGTAAAGDFAIALGTTTFGSASGTLGTLTTIDCPTGMTVSGMTGAIGPSGDVSGIALECGAPRLAVRTTTPALGGTGVDVWDCPDGQLPISFTGDSTISSYYDNTLMEVRFGCGFLSVTANGTGGWIASVSSGGADLPLTGALGNYSSHAAAATATCPVDQVVVGIAGDSGMWGPSQLVLYCAPLTVTGDARAGFTLHYGTPTAQTPIGSGGGSPPASHGLALCPQGMVGLGWRTTSGEVVDGLDLRCGTPPILPL